MSWYSAVMQIDRSRFLFLVSAIAAGCGPRTQSVSPTPPPPADAGIGATTVPAPTSAPKDNYPPPVAEGGSPPPFVEGPVSEGGVAWPTPVSEGGPVYEGGGSSLPSLEGMGIPIKSWTCSGNDDVGKAPACAVKVPKSCAPFPFVHQACSGAHRYFKPKIAERAVSCMNKLKPDAVCAAMTYECKEKALRSACPDPAADVACAAIAQKCPKTNLVECKRYLNGLNAQGRTAVEQCMSGPGCGWGIYSCTEGLND